MAMFQLSGTLRALSASHTPRKLQLRQRPLRVRVEAVGQGGCVLVAGRQPSHRKVGGGSSCGSGP